MAQDMSSTHGGSPPENYERFFVPAIGGPIAKDLMDVAALCEGERVLDVACGTGVVTRLAAEAVGPDGSVTGLDINPGMLAVARANTPPGATIAWHEGNAESMPLPDRAFDVVLCQMGLQFVGDKAAALREMHRVLAPGGRLVVNVPGPTSAVFTVLEAALGRHIGPEAAGFVRAVFSLHDVDGLQALIANAGFADTTVRANTKTLHLPAPEEFLWQYIHATPLAAVVGQADEQSRKALERDVVTEWRPFVQGKDFSHPQRVVHATGRKSV